MTSSSLFLSDLERDLIKTNHAKQPMNRFYWSLLNRTQKRASNPGLCNPATDNVEWWHVASTALTEAAMACAIYNSPAVQTWLRDATLSIVRRSEDDWIGPAFRDHLRTPRIGHLETAHLCWGVAIALDLAPQIFSEAEQSEIRDVLRNRGIPLCMRWLAANHNLMNWRFVLTAGVAVPAAIIKDQDLIEKTMQEYQLGAQAFQSDGSYGESLQYANYAAYALMFTYEALIRSNPNLESQLPVENIARYVRWAAAMHLYRKPLTGWGAYPRARAANFNDSAAIFQPSGDLLLHFAVRAKKKAPVEAGLARWLFNLHYLSIVGQTPGDRESFGFINTTGFLTLPLLEQSAEPISPEEAGIKDLTAFSNGDVIARRDKTILAIHGGGDPLNTIAHQHRDLNSFILVHNQERIFVDPGHACYRNLIHDVECSAQTHNTITVHVPSTGTLLEQTSIPGPRAIIDGKLANPIDRGAQRLLAAKSGSVYAIGSDAAETYGGPLQQYARFWLQAGSHVLFIIDHIISTEPVTVTWNWLLNNRDKQLDLKILPPDRLVARRGATGMKLFHLAGANLQGPYYGHVHDAYHPLPDQPGEGKPGSGIVLRWRESTAVTQRTAVHAIVVDDDGSIAGWHLKHRDNSIIIEGPGASETWSLDIHGADSRYILHSAHENSQYRVELDHHKNWNLYKT